MTVTAARLGASPILCDWSSLGVGSTVSDSDHKEIIASWQRLRSRFMEGEVGFYNAPIDFALSQARECQETAHQVLLQKKFTDCLFLGIGGSALGPLSLLSALQERMGLGHSAPQPIPYARFHFVDNPDPVDWRATLSRLNPETTLVCIVTKSGSTFETMAQTLLALQWLGKSRWKSNCIAITDPENGDLRAFSKQHSIAALSIASSIGGRFSVFSPVGLFPAALAGLSIVEFLKGAEQVRDYTEKTAPTKNPLFLIGTSLVKQFVKRPIHVCMPYSTRLKLIGNWFVQLWGESLGKDGKGFTPLAALGATDQHSILQLLRDGPDDKITFFLTIDRIAEPVLIPRFLVLPPLPSFTLLEGHSLQTLLQTEFEATSLVLLRRERPQFLFKLDQLDERSLGALYFTLCVLTAFTGTYWNVNPFDQPGVEEGKGYTRQKLEAVRGSVTAHPQSEFSR